jgi:D-tyrosyl-tRNA(Tyr) deacylase
MRGGTIDVVRAVVQRVSQARVTVGDEVVGEIAHGLVVLVGVTGSDVAADSRALAGKIVSLRVFRDEDGLMNRSVSDVEGSVLVVSQFTLYGDVRRGRRPSFADAAPPEMAAPLVSEVVAAVAEAGVATSEGRFGAMMEVALVNDGPVTILLETQGGRVI